MKQLTKGMSPTTDNILIKLVKAITKLFEPCNLNWKRKENNYNQSKFTDWRFSQLLCLNINNLQILIYDQDTDL